jgi:hypothetical protein
MISLLNREDSFKIVRSSTKRRQGWILTSGKLFAEKSKLRFRRKLYLFSEKRSKTSKAKLA